MPRNDGVRMGAGGAVIQEVVEELNQKKLTKVLKLKKLKLMKLRFKF